MSFSDDDSQAVVMPVFGAKPSSRIWGLVGGGALVAAAVAVAVYAGGVLASGKVVKLTAGLGLGGLAWLGTTFRVRGAAFEAGGLRIWTYWAWLFGGEKFVTQSEIHSFRLGHGQGKYLVTVMLKDGSEFDLPESWAAVKDAQDVIDLGVRLYSVGVEISIQDEAAADEAVAFSRAARWHVRPAKGSAGEGERLRLTCSDGRTKGEIRVRIPWFRANRAVIYEHPDDAEAGNPFCEMVKPVARSRVLVRMGGADAGTVQVTSGFSVRRLRLWWKDPGGIVWSAVFEGDGEHRDPFTLRFHRGLAEGVGGKAERDEAAAQGDAVLVAVANGPAKAFTVDVADERAWPWIRIALASVWLNSRPRFKPDRE